MAAMSRADGDPFQISEISGKAFPGFAQDSRRFNLAFTISRYNFSIDSRNAD
jgi:hypothetical protein